MLGRYFPEQCSSFRTYPQHLGFETEEKSWDFVREHGVCDKCLEDEKMVDTGIHRMVNLQTGLKLFILRQHNVVLNGC